MRFPSHALMKVAVPKSDARQPTRLNIPDWTHCVISGMRGLVSLCSLIGVLILLPVCAAAQAPTKRVLILSGSDPNYPGFSIINQGLRSVVRNGSSSRVEFIYELQEGLVMPPDSERDDQELVAYLSRKYAGKKIDLIFGLVAPRLRVLFKSNPGLFADIPKIIYDFEEEREATVRDLGPNVTGVWAKVELTKTLDLALVLQPEARRVVVVTGNSDQDRIRREKAQMDFRKYESRAEFIYPTNLTLDELKGQLAGLPKNCIVMYLTFSTDRAGNKYSGPEALSMIAPTSGAPIYGNSDTFMGAGIVGGSLINFEAIGKRVGEVSLRILAGEKPKDIPSSTMPNVTTFDWRELRRWGISEASLPPGSEVRFKEFTFWELYKWRIIAVLALCVIEALLIAFLLFERRKRQRAMVQLDERVRFESLLSKLSAEFIDLPASKVDTVVKQWLDRLKEFLGDVTISFFEVPASEGAAVTVPTGDASRFPRALAVKDVKEDEWCLAQLRKGTTINLPNVPAALSSENIGGKSTAGLKSLLAIPVAVNGKTFALALGTNRSYSAWDQNQLSQLRLVSEIFAGAFERQRSGEELQKTRNDLAHVGRLTAMGEMAASIAHEVNQPLAAIATYGDACLLLLSGESPNVKKSLEAINHIISDSMRASEVIKRIRGLVKKTAHENAPLDLNQIILEMVALTDADMQARSVQLKLHLADDLPLVLGDRVELQQVMLNLILNSIEAMSATVDRVRGLTISSSLNGGGQVLVKVQDSGVGLNSEQARHVFDPFMTTKTGGLGLGLSISRTIIEAHDGRLWAELNEGPGAIFQFTLPKAGEE